MAAFDSDIFGRAAMAAALRQRDPNSTAPTGNGGVVPGAAMGGLSNAQQPMVQQNPQNSNPLSGQSAGNIAKYIRGLQGGGGATAAAGEAAMPAMSAGGGSSLGSMGLMQAPVSFPGAAAAGGGAGAGGAAGGAAMGGLGALGAGAGAVLGGLLADSEMNENPNSVINADRINNMGTIGNSGIGLRGGDLVNGFNPATWLSDPKKAAKGLGNAFTFGLLDKIL